MSVGKEALVTLETLAREQKQIYNDSCDYGIVETEVVYNQVKGALRELKELEGVKASKFLHGRQCVTRLGLEQDGPRIHGYRICVARIDPRLKTGKPPYFVIDVQPSSWIDGEPLI